MTSFLDSGRTNGQIYYYKVTALNAIGESLASNEANATPVAPVVPPVEPLLPVVDSFGRGNENPLSDGGRWSNGIIGSAETGLRVTSNQLASTKTTTCTAWRNNALFGPDVEILGSHYDAGGDWQLLPPLRSPEQRRAREGLDTCCGPCSRPEPIRCLSSDSTAASSSRD